MPERNRNLNISIVSLKYAPGLTKEFTLIGDKLAGLGFNVSYIVSNAYSSMMGQRQCCYVSSSNDMRSVIADTLMYKLGRRACLQTAISSSVPDIVFIYNQHPLNISLLKLVAKNNAQCKNVLYIHEPGKMDLSGYGFKGRIVYNYLDSILSNSLSFCSDVALPSEYALDIFQNRYSSFNGGVHLCPLFGQDDPGKKQARNVFSMVGRFNYTKPVSPLIDLANYCVENDIEYRFSIATSSDIDTDVKRLSQKADAQVNVVNPSELSDKQVNDVLAGSKAVFCLHRNVVQSGVVPVAFMNSTPVIAINERGFTQHVSHGENGYILPENYCWQDMVCAMNYVTDNFEILSNNARKSYDSIFSDNNWQKCYQWLIG